MPPRKRKMKLSWSVIVIAVWASTTGLSSCWNVVSTRHTRTTTRRRRLPLLLLAEEDHHALSHVPVYDAKANTALDRYRHEHARSLANPDDYWAEQAAHYLDWDVPFESVLQGSFANAAWFTGGKLSVSYNAIDRHVLAGRGDHVALISEGDEPDDTRHITYSQLLTEVSQIANALKSVGVKKGDVVTIYMPMIPELPMTMLACSRIGAVHSVVFAGFSAEALGARIAASDSKCLVTADQGVRGGKKIPLKDIVDQARTTEGVEDCLENVLVWERFCQDRLASSFELKDKDVRMNALVARQRPYCPALSMDAEDNLFILYTSGSTGQPKGLVHTTAGYALYAALTTHRTFDLLPDTDIFACVADCGWITGHTYTVYGPLLNGATTVLFESTPLYPDPGRYWDMIQRHSITQFYTAPTAIRSLMRFGSSIPKNYDLSSLKILGSVGGMCCK